MYVIITHAGDAGDNVYLVMTHTGQRIPHDRGAMSRGPAPIYHLHDTPLVIPSPFAKYIILKIIRYI